MAECKCDKCKAACTVKPGWYKPNELEGLARYLNMPLTEAFRKFLGVDWYEAWESPIFLIAPATTSMSPGDMYRANPKGQCIFYKDGKCSIYKARPHECRTYKHTDSRKIVEERHKAVAKSWDKIEHQDKVRELFGAEPQAAESSFIDSMYW